MTESSTCIEAPAIPLVVHPGIGDLSWVISKLSTTGRKFDLIIAEDKKTRRAMALVEMVDCINKAEYGGFDEYYPLAKCGNATFEEYLKAGVEGKKLYLTANNWLEKGRRLEGYLPDLDTDFHYALNTEDDDDWVTDLFCGKRGHLFGVYTSGMAGIAAWRGWSHLEWTDFIRQVEFDYPDTTFVFLGAKWDRDMREPMLRMMDEYRINYIDLIGRTSLPRVTAVVKQLDYFAGYASGLTILANVVNTPVLMLYPGYLHKLIRSWPCPISLATGDYQGHAWDRPYTIYTRVKRHIADYLN